MTTTAYPGLKPSAVRSSADEQRRGEAGFAGTLTPVPSPTRTPATRERGATTQRLQTGFPLSRAGVSACGRGGQGVRVRAGGGSSGVPR